MILEKGPSTFKLHKKKLASPFLHTDTTAKSMKCSIEAFSTKMGFGGAVLLVSTLNDSVLTCAYAQC